MQRAQPYANLKYNWGDINMNVVKNTRNAYF